jgi:hypothetical protein
LRHEWDDGEGDEGERHAAPAGWGDFSDTAMLLEM